MNQFIHRINFNLMSYHNNKMIVIYLP